MIGIGVALMLAQAAGQTLSADDSQSPSASAGAETPETIAQFTPAVRALLLSSKFSDDEIDQFFLYGHQTPFQLDEMKGEIWLSRSTCVHKPGASSICSGPTLNFKAKLPVSQCISTDEVGKYLIQYGWKVAEIDMSYFAKRRIVPDLLPLHKIYEDNEGALLSVAPYLRNGCITDVRISNLNGRGK